jgi:hypothetical protein
VFHCVLGSKGCVSVPRSSGTLVATWAWPTWVVSRRRVLEAAFMLLEFPSPSRRIFIGSHSLPPSLVRRIGPSRLTRRALEGGPAAPSNAFSVTIQGHAATSGRRERSFLLLSALCGHPRHYSATPGIVTTSPTLLECAGTRRRHNRHCATYGPPVDGTLEPTRGGGRASNHYVATLEAAPVRAQDAPRHPDWSGIHQDGRQLHGAARHASTRRETVRHACKLLPPWPIKGGQSPSRRGDGTMDSNHHTLSAFSTILALASINTSRTWRPGLLSHHACSPPLRAPRCNAIKCPEHITAGRTAPAETRITQFH